MDVRTFVRPVAGFASLPMSVKTQVFAWYLHSVREKETFKASDINECFDALHLPRPANATSLLNGMTVAKPKRVLGDSKAFRLSALAREEMEKLLPRRPSTVVATSLLRDLELRLTAPHQKTFLAETLRCFSCEAYRSAIVMAWNLAYSHVCDVIFDAHLAEFNAQLKCIRPKAVPITKRTDFEDHRESLVLEVARGAGIVSQASFKTLTEKLTKRNTSAHPSSTIVRAVTAEEVIHDLVENIVLRPVL